jgi:hypothetical protein
VFTIKIHFTRWAEAGKFGLPITESTAATAHYYFIRKINSVEKFLL